MHHSGVILQAKSLELLQGVTVLVTELVVTQVVVPSAQSIHDMRGSGKNRAFTGPAVSKGKVIPSAPELPWRPPLKTRGQSRESWPRRAHPQGLTNLNKSARGFWASSGPGRALEFSALVTGRSSTLLTEPDLLFFSGKSDG